MAAAVPATALLAGCGSSPSGNITLAEAGQSPAASPDKSPAASGLKFESAPAAPGANTAIQGVHAVPVRSTLVQPGCKRRECPTITVDSVAFPEIPALTTAVDHALADMTGIDANLRGDYRDLKGYQAYFWRTAQARDKTYLKADLKGVVGDVISVELITEQMVTGAAHPVPATRYLLWQRSTGHEITLADLLVPGRHDQYVEALRAAYERWLATNPGYVHDPAAYHKLWPFVPSDNVALTRQGLVVKYDSYTIAPHSDGQPEITLGLDALNGILRPEFMPK
jgi:hypothetical protein